MQFKWFMSGNVAALGAWIARRSQVAHWSLVGQGAGGLLPGHERESVFGWAEHPNADE
jgi:hypothetical protein